MFTQEDVIVASVSFDDRYYTSPACAECGETLEARTMADLEAQMREHWCDQDTQGDTPDSVGRAFVTDW